METAIEFMKLEKIEIGGIKGKSLSQQVVQVFEEFNELFKVFTERSYDCMDPTQTEFITDYTNFNNKVADLDRRLATIICQAFDDCSGLEAVYKVKEQ